MKRFDPQSRPAPSSERAEVRILKQKKRRDDAICLLILSALSLVLGVVFLSLSFRYNFLHQRIFVPASLEFVTCCLFFAAGVSLLGWGSARFALSSSAIRLIQKEGEND